MTAESTTRRTARELRRFGLTVGGIFVLLGTLSWLRAHELAPRILWAAGALLVGPGLLAPELLRGVERGWMRLAAALGHVNGRFVLTLVFFLVVTPIGMVLRLVRDPLNRRLDDGATSNWTRRAPGPVDPERYHRQF